MKAHRTVTHDLHMFLVIIALLIITGGLFIYSASSVFALEKFGSSHYFVKKQLIGFCIGLFGLFVARIVPLNFIKKLSPYLFFGSVGLTALTLLSHMGQRIHGSHRWLSLGGFTFQPSELLKITLIIYLAYFIERKMTLSHSFLQRYIPLFIILGLPSIILLLQPDFGMTVTIVITSILMLFIAQCNIKHLLISLACLIPAGIGLILMRPYRLQRVLTFLNPWQDPKGSGFQVIQSLIAIGSGGFWGVGIGNSKQKFFYLPMQHTDFIFSIIAEETGFLGCLLLVLLYVLFLYFGIRVACQLRSSFATLTTLGFVALVNLQAIINIAVATGLAPTKGLGLPFVSYGNSALICNMFMVGLVMNMAYTAHAHSQESLEGHQGFLFTHH
jgi:cell division protein FtsW